MQTQENGSKGNAQVDGKESTGEGQQTQSNQPESFEAWLEGQEDGVKQLYEAHVSNLKSAVKATRDERDVFKQQLKTAQMKAEKGSELEQSLTDAIGKLESAERRASFFEDASKPEIGCRNPRIAFAVATAEDLFTKSGQPDWQALRAAAPELFATNKSKGSAGNGTDHQDTPQNMNQLIRRSAGVQ